MDNDFVFIFDGECPFCNKFAELLELKSGLSQLKVKDGRENINELNDFYSKGYDLDNGAILLKNGEIFHGAEAINCICREIKQPSDQLLILLKNLFVSKTRTNIFFPFLVWARRITLLVKGVNWKPVKM